MKTLTMMAALCLIPAMAMARGKPQPTPTPTQPPGDEQCMEITVPSSVAVGRHLSEPTTFWFPLAGEPSPITGETEVTAPVHAKEGKQYSMDVGLLAFDTSFLPDGSIVTSANIKLYITAHTSGRRTLVMEYYELSPFSVDWTWNNENFAPTWTNLSSQSAHVGTGIRYLVDGTYNTFQLVNLDQIYDDTPTGFRLHFLERISPKTTDFVTWQGLDDVWSVQNPPLMQICYRPPHETCHDVHAGPGCSTLGCETCVCYYNADCCKAGLDWTLDCVNLAYWCGEPVCPFDPQ